jgi:hypothetical protein
VAEVELDCAQSLNVSGEGFGSEEGRENIVKVDSFALDD